MKALILAKLPVGKGERTHGQDPRSEDGHPEGDVDARHPDPFGVRGLTVGSTERGSPREAVLPADHRGRGGRRQGEGDRTGVERNGEGRANHDRRGAGSAAYRLILPSAGVRAAPQASRMGNNVARTPGSTHAPQAVSILEFRSAIRTEEVLLVLHLGATVGADQRLFSRGFGERSAARPTESMVRPGRVAAARARPGHGWPRPESPLVRT